MADFVGAIGEGFRMFFSTYPWIFPLVGCLFSISLIFRLISIVVSPFGSLDFTGFFSFIWSKIKSFGIWILLKLGVIYLVEEESAEDHSDET